MHTKIRRSALKHRKRTGFRRGMRTKGGRKAISNQRALAAGKKKRRPGNQGRGKKLNINHRAGKKK